MATLVIFKNVLMEDSIWLIFFYKRSFIFIQHNADFVLVRFIAVCFLVSSEEFNPIVVAKLFTFSDILKFLGILHLSFLMFSYNFTLSCVASSFLWLSFLSNTWCWFLIDDIWTLFCRWLKIDRKVIHAHRCSNTPGACFVFSWETPGLLSNQCTIRIENKTFLKNFGGLLVPFFTTKTEKIRRKPNDGCPWSMLNFFHWRRIQNCSLSHSASKKFLEKIPCKFLGLFFFHFEEKLMNFKEKPEDGWLWSLFESLISDCQSDFFLIGSLISS